MLLTVEIISAIALLALLIYFKREQIKTFIKKIISFKVFPKVFWGSMLGLGWIYFICCGDEFLGGFFNVVTKIKILDTTAYIRGLHFVGPLFGIFVGITVGASTRPFNVKKLLICILAGFLGGLAYSTKILFSASHFINISNLTIFVFASMPFAIGIADKSLFKAVIGLIGEGMAIGFLWALLVLGILSGVVPLFNWPTNPWAFPSLSIAIISGIFILIGIEMSEFKDTLKDFFKGIRKSLDEF